MIADVHTYGVRHRAAASATVDAEGRVTHSPVTEQVRGVVTLAGATAIRMAAQAGVQVDVVALASLETAVDRTDQLIVPEDVAGLQGTYDVTLIRPNRRHLRIFATRTIE